MYPDRHHPVYFLLDALQASGVRADFAKDERTRGCWGMVFPDFDNRIAVWLIDNRHEHERINEDPAARELLASGALVMHAQRPDYERIGGDGYWLPLAASPGYAPRAVIKTHDAAFIGYLRDLQRVARLADVAAVCNLAVAGGVFGEDAVNLYNSARVGVNVPTRWGMPNTYDSFNMRLPEIAACGIVPVTPYEDYLADAGFIDGETCITYGKTRSITDAVKMALDNTHIGFNARQLIIEQHTYQHRAGQVKQWLNG